MIKSAFITFLGLFLVLVTTSMVYFQLPELRYDFGPKEPVMIDSPEQLADALTGRQIFASVKGTINFDRAATFSKHGVRYTYFMLNEYDTALVVRTYETINEDWAGLDRHLGRFRKYRRMPFSRSVRAGFHKNFDITIPDSAFFLGRDDVPKPSGWSVGAAIFAVTLWCILVYFFFVRRLYIAISKRNQKKDSSTQLDELK